MKQGVFLSVLSVFAIFHIVKAGPLRLHKRAAFYIANETACVVDNIVYSNGDPIPTDDPCEACRCRPPGFACVLKDCKIKPGCRAVRHAGQCCPEYICGCEHNGRLYLDGDEILDPKNPCYRCHCQGSSIACSFVDCPYRDDCDTVFEPGECCPKHTNCTRDPTEGNPLTGNALPPINLLPAFNNEPILPEDSLLRNPAESSEDPTEPPEPLQDNESGGETPAPENEPAADQSPTAEPDLVTAESQSDPEVKVTEAEETSSRDEETDKQDEEVKILLNSESDIKKDEILESTISVTDPVVDKVTGGESQTTTENKLPENEAKVTEGTPKYESTSTEKSEVDPQIRNSASENSKSLKLLDNDQEVSVKEQLSNDKPQDKEAITEIMSDMQINDTKQSSPEESTPKSEYTAAEDNQTNTQAVPQYSKNEKIKSESAETVTIIVHVKDKPKLTTETDFITVSKQENVSTEPQENLLKSRDELVSTDTNKESPVDDNTESTGKNFEIFATSTSKADIEQVNNSPSKVENSEEVQERSSEIDIIESEAEENSVGENSESATKVAADPSETTTAIKVADVDQEARADEEAPEETKEDKSTLVTKVDPNEPIRIETVQDTTESQKPEGSPNEDKTTEEIKLVTPQEETMPEVRESEHKVEEHIGKTASIHSGEEQSQERNESPTEREDDSLQTENAQESTSTEKAKESVSTEKEQNNGPTEAQESAPMEKVQEPTNQQMDDKQEKRTIVSESDENGESKEDKSEETLVENKSKGSSDENKSEEKPKEDKSGQTSEENKSEEKLENKSEETPEENKSEEDKPDVQNPETHEPKQAKSPQE